MIFDTDNVVKALKVLIYTHFSLLLNIKKRQSVDNRQVWQVYLFYNQKIIDPCGTYIQLQVNTGINIGIIYNWLT